MAVERGREYNQKLYRRHKIKIRCVRHILVGRHFQYSLELDAEEGRFDPVERFVLVCGYFAAAVVYMKCSWRIYFVILDGLIVFLSTIVLNVL